MKTEEKLWLLTYAKQFHVTKRGDKWEIKSKKYDVGAMIFPDDAIKYYVTGCYNSGCDWRYIDMKELMDLKEFCELMVGDDDEA